MESRQDDFRSDNSSNKDNNLTVSLIKFTFNSTLGIFLKEAENPQNIQIAIRRKKKYARVKSHFICTHRQFKI